MRHSLVFGLLILMLPAAVMLSGCSDDPANPPGSGDPAAYTNADGINGGRMYDKFWASETGFDSSKDVSFDFGAHADFFRCKQCHGWDRLGREGAYIGRGPRTTRPNVADVDLRAYAADHSAQEIFDNLSSSVGRRPLSSDLSSYDPVANATVGDQMPDLSEIFSDAQLWELVKFLKHDATDVDDLYTFATSGTYPSGSIAFSDIGAGGDAVNGNAIFTARCAMCHGADGTMVMVDGGEYTVGRHLRNKPYEDHHKMKFGQLGSAMGSLVTDLQELQDLFAALADETDYPDDPPPPADYVNADGANGGRIYDKFWAVETGFDQGDPDLATYSSHSDFFRCKQCHGWDRLGNQGAYINRAPRTTRPRVDDLDLIALSGTYGPQEMFDAIKSSAGRRSPTADLSTYDPETNPAVGEQMPDYSQILTDGQIWDLVKFLLEDAIDVNDLYGFTLDGGYPDGTITFSDIGRDGNAANGDAIFAARCSVCHGADGTAIGVDGGYSVGSHLRGKPNEDQHKFKFGQLGTGMTGLVTDLDDMKDLYKALTNATTYPDPAPTAR